MNIHFINSISTLKKFAFGILLSCFASGFTPLSLAADTATSPPLSSSVIVEDTININRASAEDIASRLKGIGFKKAQAIIAWREKNGDFTDIDQLLEVKGVGEKILEMNKSQVSL